MERSRLRTVILAGIVIAAVAIPAAALVLQSGIPATGTITLETNDGPLVEVTTTGTDTFDFSDAFVSDTELSLQTSEGNVTLSSDTRTEADISTNNISGTWTNVTSLSVDGSADDLKIDPEDKPAANISGDATAFAFADMTLSDGRNDFWVSGPDGGTATVTVRGLTANTDIAAVDPNSGTYLDSATTDGSGTATLTIGLSAHTVRLLSVSPDAPALSNPDPTGVVSTSPTQLSVDVNDPDFGSNADEVQVTFWLDGSQIHQENITSNESVTASVSKTYELGDTGRWNVTATDSYGEQDTQNNSFVMPSNVTLRSETNASKIITNQNVTATFYDDSGNIVVQRSDNDGDGNISMKGLPDESFVVTFSGTDKWHDRRAYIDSIGEQQNIYLLNATKFETDNDTAIETTFVYEDRTGEFDQSNTTLEIERAVDVNDDGTFSWEVVAGDYWGAAGEFPFTGEYQARYRLRITNQDTGESRLLGTHIPTDDGVKNIIVGKVIFEAGNATGRYWNASINQDTSNLQAYYNDPTNKTTDLRITIYEQGNASNELFNQSFAGPVGEKLVSASLTNNQTEMNWVVEFEGTHESDGQVFGKVLVGNAEYPLPIDPDILAAFVYVMVTFVMALYGPRTAVIGAWAGVLAFGGAAFLGWVSGVTLAVPVVVAIGATFYNEAMP